MNNTCNYDIDNPFVIPNTIDILFNKSKIYEILNDYSEQVTGYSLSKDVFHVIWDKIDFSNDDIDTDVLYNLDNVYTYDIVYKSAIKYKKKKKSTYKLKRLYRYDDYF